MSSFTQITASAGAGKTYSLTDKFLRLVRQEIPEIPEQDACCGSAHPSPDFTKAWQKIMDALRKDILAITFTNKTAADLRDDLLEKLKKIALGLEKKENIVWENKEPGKAGYWPKYAGYIIDYTLRHYSALNIRTIDSLLHMIVRLSALDLGIPPEFEPTFDDAEVSGAIFDALALTAVSGDEEYSRMFREACGYFLNNNPKGFLFGGRFRDEALSLAKYLMQKEYEDRLLPPDNKKPVATEEEIKNFAGNLCARFKADAKILKEALGEEALLANFKKALDNAESVKSCYDIRNIRPTYFSKENLSECLKTKYQSKADRQNEAAFDRLKKAYADAAILKQALGVLPFLALGNCIKDKIDEHVSAEGIVPASLIPYYAQDALKGGAVSTLVCSLATRIRHILIDEFQDTSRGQWNAMLPLIEEALGNNGSLTQVGDVKQAIYGWRGGDSKLFSESAEDPRITCLLTDKPQPQNLPCNWRSHANVIDWNNAFFCSLAKKDFVKEQFSKLTGERSADAQKAAEDSIKELTVAFKDVQQDYSCITRDGGYVRMTRWNKEDEEDEDAFIKGKILELIDELLERKIPLSSICILTRSNTQCQKAAEWLMQRDDGKPQVPVVTEGSLLIAKQPVVAEFLSLMRFLAMPDDDVHFMAVLNGKLLRCKACTEIWKDFSLETFYGEAEQKRGGLSLSDFFRKQYPEIWKEVFAPLLDHSSRHTPYDFVTMLKKEGDILSRFPGQEGVLRRFLEILHCAEKDGIADLAGFLEFWDGKGKEERVPMPEQMDAVRIMTIHKSKGLQFPVVILPWLEFEITPKRDKIICYSHEGITFLAPLCKEMGEPWLEQLFTNTQESLNLVYVAMTRAEQELYCFLPKDKEDEGKKSGKAAFVSILNSLTDKLMKSHQEKGLFKYENDVLEWGEPVAQSDAEQKMSNAVSEKGPRTEGTCADPGRKPDGKEPQAEDGKGKNSSPSRDSDLDWMPRLRLFRTPKDDLGDWSGLNYAKTRGTLIHHCLEFLVYDKPETIRENALFAANRGIETFPVPVPDKEEMREKIADILEWYLSQNDTPAWLEKGMPEKEIYNQEGKRFIIDRLVDEGDALLAVEYKTGSHSVLPDPKHVEQLQNYIALLKEAQKRPVHGVLVYLDDKQIINL